MMTGQRQQIAAIVVTLTAMALASGCAMRGVSVAPPETEAEPACRVVSGDAEEPWHTRAAGEPWTDGGSHFVVCAAAAPVTSERESAGAVESEAIRQAYAFAFDRLAGRGVRFADDQVRRMVGDRVEASRRGEDVSFPRIRVAGRLIQSCARRPEGPREWRESLLVEYPIAYLRGDVNNARWHTERAINEAEVIISSAKSFFAEGRWFDGVLELERCRQLLGSASSAERTERVSAELERLGSWASGALSIRPAADVVVIEAGQRRRTDVAFLCSCEWDGATVPAVGVPVEFLLRGFDAVFHGAPESDAVGVAKCGIVSAYGTERECSIEARVDLGVLAAAVGEGVAQEMRAQAQTQKVFLVRGAHAVSVCLEIHGLDSVDEAQLRAGFDRRAGSEGYHVEDCGADVAAVVTADAAKSSEQLGEGDAWSATVVLAASAFDQRVATEIGETTISIEERAHEGPREAEILALREAGRLLAAYVSSRILLSRG